MFCLFRTHARAAIQARKNWTFPQSRLTWLLETEEGRREADRDLQIVETERVIAVGSRAQEAFPIPANTPS